MVWGGKPLKIESAYDRRVATLEKLTVDACLFGLNPIAINPEMAFHEVSYGHSIQFSNFSSAICTCHSPAFLATN